MTLCQNKDLLSIVRSSYLWNNDEGPSNNTVDVATHDSDILNGLSQAVPPRLSTIIEGSQLSSAENVPKKEVTATSLSEMRLTSTEVVKPDAPRTSNVPVRKDSQIPIVEQPLQSSRFAILTRNGKSICQCRIITVACVSLVLVLCAISIGVPLGIALRPTDSTITSTTTTTTSSTSTTSTTSTTTTPPATQWIPSNYYVSCLATCITVSTVTPATLLASWKFEQNANDASGNGENGQVMNGAVFTTGYIGEAIELQSNSAQFVSASYISLVNQSFTVEAWIYAYSLVTSTDHCIFTECEVNLVDRCLHFIVRQNKLYMGFFSDDISANTNLTTHVWYHVAFVYDYSSNIKSIYLNGLIDGISTASGVNPSIGPYLGASGNVTIGSWSFHPSTYWDGLLDQLTVTNRVKTPCEILNDASLVAHFTFDTNYNDIGPNAFVGTYTLQNNNGLLWVAGQVNQALSFNSSNSYFESCGFYALGQNQAYSIAMWVNPSFQSGTLFHLSSADTGSGAWCLPMIGFSSNGSLVAQTWIGGTVSIMGPILPINMWTHIVQTYSSTNGLRLYINGGLYNSAAANRFSSSSLVMCVLLGSSGLGTNCQTGSISMGPYSGAIDEFYVYNRELNNLEVCPLAHA